MGSLTFLLCLLLPSVLSWPLPLRQHVVTLSMSSSDSDTSEFSRDEEFQVSSGTLEKRGLANKLGRFTIMDYVSSEILVTVNASESLAPTATEDVFYPGSPVIIPIASLITNRDIISGGSPETARDASSFGLQVELNADSSEREEFPEHRSIDVTGTGIPKYKSPSDLASAANYPGSSKREESPIYLVSHKKEMTLDNAALSSIGYMSHDLVSNATATIINGTHVAIGFMDEAFLYCFGVIDISADFRRYRVEWIDPKGDTLHEWEPDLGVSTLGQQSGLPHMYLVFHDFSDRAVGEYWCKLYFDENLVSSASILVEANG